MKFGLTDTHYATIVDLAIRPLKSAGAKVFVFGSRARGNQRKFSDLDLAVECPTPLSLSFLAKIRSALEESDLPVKVDVVDMSELAESFRNNVLQERIEV